ncbi:MAG: hypothetical protein ACK5LJ_05705 [Paracoccus sp. (in: a-proteobacteria)]
MFGSLFGAANSAMSAVGSLLGSTSLGSLFGSGSSLTGGLTNIIGGVSDTVSDIATDLANGVSTIVSNLDESLSDLLDNIAENTPAIPLVKGIVDAAATIVDGATDAVEIVVHHVMMWVAEAGQAVGTVGNGTADTIDAIFEADPEGVLCVLQDTAGKLIITNQQYTAAHLAHDVALVQIPLEMVSEGLSEVLCSVIGDNLLSQAPYMLDGVQKLVIDEGLYKSVIVPLMTEWALANKEAFGDLLGTQNPEDMGMGFDFDEDYWDGVGGHDHSAMAATIDPSNIMIVEDAAGETAAADDSNVEASVEAQLFAALDSLAPVDPDAASENVDYFDVNVENEDVSAADYLDVPATVDVVDMVDADLAYA